MKIAIYSRKSKFTEEGESIENQINMCIKYAETMLGITDYEIYEDEGFSGGNTNRPNFQKLIRDIKRKKFTHLICYRLDRISRNVADFTNTLEILNKYNCAFISIKEQFDTSTAMGRAMMNISATFAQLERETIAERIRDNLRELAKTGRWLGGPAPLGYKSIEVENDSNGKSKKKHILTVNEDEIDMVKTLFKLFLEHKSYQRTAKALNELGFTPRHSKIFNLTIVKQALNNPCYIIADKKILNYFNSKGCNTFLESKCNGSNGLMAYHRRDENNRMLDINEWIISVGDHKGIITSDEWLKCQEIIQTIKNKPSNRQGTSKDFLLSGLIVCAKCGSSMSGRSKTIRNTEYRYYACNLKNRASKECGNTNLNAYEAEEQVVKYLVNITAEDIISNYDKTQRKQLVKFDNAKLMETYSKEIETNKSYISGLIKKIAIEEDEDIVEEYKNELRRIKNKNKELTNLITELENKNNNIEEITESLDDILETFKHFKRFYNFTEKFEDKQRLIRSIVKFIIWDSETQYLDIVLKGSGKQKPFSQLGDRIR